MSLTEKALNFPSGIYEGDNKNMKPQGKGTFYFYNGDRYFGTWKDGKMHGKGVYYFNNRSRYEVLLKLFYFLFFLNLKFL
jgi:hypothetical protein